MKQLSNILSNSFTSVIHVLLCCFAFQKVHSVIDTTQKYDNKEQTSTPYFENLQNGDNSSNISTTQEMVIFDLDYVLWPFFVDTDKRFNKTFPTLSKQGNGTIAPYPEVKDVVEYLIKRNFTLGLIGQVEKTERAIHLLKLFNFHDYFQFIELGIEKKLSLILRIQSSAGVLKHNILFIEYDYNKVESDEVLDVLYEHIFLMYIDDEGLTMKYIKQALFVFDQRPNKVDISKIKKDLFKEYGIETKSSNKTQKQYTVRPKVNITTTLPSKHS